MSILREGRPLSLGDDPLPAPVGIHQLDAVVAGAEGDRSVPPDDRVGAFREEAGRGRGRPRGRAADGVPDAREGCGHHNPKFRKLAKRVCTIHGFDPETF